MGENLKQTDLTNVNPSLANKIMSQINYSVAMNSPDLSLFSKSFAQPRAPSATKAVPPAAAPSPTQYERVGQMLAYYKEAVNAKLREVTIKTVANLAFIIPTLVFLVLAIVYSNLSSLVASIGLGGTSIIAQATTFKDGLVTYLGDCGDIKGNLRYLDAEYNCCNRDDPVAVQKVNDDVCKDFQALNNAQASTQASASTSSSQTPAKPTSASKPSGKKPVSTQ